MTQIIERKNGYYISEKTNKYYPSVSTILSKSGGAGGLVEWAAKQGGLGVIWALRRIQNYSELQTRLESTSCINWALESAIQGLQAEQKRVMGYGTDAHAGFEAIINGKDYVSDINEVNLALNTFKQFWLNSGIKPLFIEEHVVSELNQYAGRLDLCVEISEQVANSLNAYTSRNSEGVQAGNVICDFKTGSIYFEKQLTQLAAYAYALEEKTGVKCNGAMLINIERDNPEKIKLYYKQREELEKAFECFIHMKKVWEYTEAPKWYNKQYN